MRVDVAGVAPLHTTLAPQDEGCFGAELLNPGVCKPGQFFFSFILLCLCMQA